LLVYFCIILFAIIVDTTSNEHVRTGCLNDEGKKKYFVVYRIRRYEVKITRQLLNGINVSNSVSVYCARYYAFWLTNNITPLPVLQHEYIFFGIFWMRLLVDRMYFQFFHRQDYTNDARREEIQKTNETRLSFASFSFTTCGLRVEMSFHIFVQVTTVELLQGMRASIEGRGLVD
jgi:hypothetical protein